jgi:3-hydroxyisobutyrate dehydrogenase
VNSLIHGLNQTVAEALTLAEAAGIAPERAFDVIEASAAAAPMLGYRRLLYLDEKAHEVTFTVALARKDMEVTAQVAEGLGVALPQGRLNLDQLREAASRGYAARDMASMVDFLREGRT